MPEILTKRHLEQIKDREDRNVFKSEVGPYEKAVAKTALMLLKILKRVEWIKVNLGEFGGEIEMCPSCRNEKQHGHYENCDFNLIKTMEVDQ